MKTQKGDSASSEIAASLWYTAANTAEIRNSALPSAPAGSVAARTLWTGVSKGTERLISAGAVPESEWPRMRCPHQDGDFPFPVKYGYSLVGRVTQGSTDWVGRNFFALHPHQDVVVLGEDEIIALPENVPLRRAILAANMETALNALWDAGAGPGDRIVVIGAGMIGCLVAYLASRLPGADVTLADINPARAKTAAALGVHFSAPEAAPGDADIVFHASASEAGFATALACAGLEATLCELSWYGTKKISIALGEHFHSKRIRLISSQVGLVSPQRRPRWTHKRRLAKALSLLDDARLDVLIDTEIEFAALPQSLPRLLSDPQVLGIAVRYP